MSEIVAAMIAAIQVAHTGVDLSDTDAVKYGEFVEPPVRPFVAIVPPDGESEPEACESWHLHTIEFPIRMWARTGTDAPDDTAAAATTMLDAVMAALAVARRTSGNKLRNAALLTFKSYTLKAPAGDSSVAPYAEMVVEIKFRRSAGVGA